MRPCPCSESHRTRGVVLAGGPGAGKTAVLELIRQSFCEHVKVLPEATGILFGGGFPRGTEGEKLRAGQRAIFYICSCPDPVLGLTEARRVLKPGGQLPLLEHVLSRRPELRRIMQWSDPSPLYIWGVHIDRDTVDNVRRAGSVDVVDTNPSLDIVKRIDGRAPEDDSSDETGRRSFGSSG